MKELTVKEIQQETLNVIKKIKEICDENNIKFFLVYGTLLGAIRHQGYIPWDDDFDIAMPRKDYERFIQYCIDHKEDIKPFELMHYRTNKKYIYGIARFSDSRYFIDYQNVKNYGLGLFVDIYPLDGINPEDKTYIKKLIRKIKNVLLNGHVHYEKTGNIIKDIIKFPYYLLMKMGSVNRKIAKLDKFAQKYDFDSHEFVSCTTWEAQECYKKDFFSETIEVPFEGIKLPITKNYDELLRVSYGDYMKLPPENERIGHHFYHAYKK